MKHREIKIDLDKKCARCGKGGAAEGGYCLGCVAERMKEGAYDHILEGGKMSKEVQADKARRFVEIRKALEEVQAIEEEIANLKDAVKEKKDEREALILNIKKIAFDRQTQLDLEN